MFKHILLFLLSACVAGAAAQPSLPLPARSATAPTGTQFYNQLLGASSNTAREQMIYDQIAAGNVPDFMRALKPITVTSGANSATYYVSPDYLAVGSNSDFFRLPMSGYLAQQVANLCGSSLPTRKIVNDIYNNSTVKLAPYPFSPSTYDITSVTVWWQSNQAIENQRAQAGAQLGAITSGIKKDVVITPELGNRPPPPRVAIYGWHQTNGTPIQPLSLVHEDSYRDYSHGIRLMKAELTVNGNATTVGAVLANSSLAALLSDEGAFTNTYPLSIVFSNTNFPYADAFPAGGRQLSTWINRFTTPLLQSFSPASPGGDGTILVVRDTSGGIDTTRLGRTSDSNYFVQCDIYCNYRPALAANGLERVGIFLRDDGNGLFTGTNGAGTIRGNNYALTWDSSDGRLRCNRTVNGTPTDLLPAAQFLPSSGWRRFRIEALGTQITFKLDSSTLLSISDSIHAQGEFGIGYQELYATNSNILGTYADNFLADVMPTAGVGEWFSFQ